MGTAYDTDADNVTAQLVSTVSHGTLTLNTDGTFTYTPNASWAGTDSFTFSAGDGAESSLPATVSIQVTNAVPTASDAAYQVTHDTALTVSQFGLVTNAFDADGDNLTAQVVTQPASGTLGFNPDGTFTYTPNAAFVGSDSFTYRVSDSVTQSNPATVTVDVVNNQPGGVDASYSIQHDASLTEQDLSLSVWDANNDALTFQLDQGPASGTVWLSTAGTFSYTPNAAFAGTDSFTYRVSDGAQPSDPVTVTIDIRNTPPVAIDRTVHVHQGTSLDILADGAGASGSDESTTPTIDLLAALRDPDDDPLTLTYVATPSNGTWTTNTDGSAVYTPNTGFLGTDTVTYKVNDGASDSNMATLTIEVTNTKPQASFDSFTTAHGQVLTIPVDSLTGNDFDFDGDAITLVNVGSPSQGTLTWDAANTRYLYDPSTFVGTTTFSYSVQDSAETSDPATVQIDVVENAPWGGHEIYTIDSGASLSAGPLAQRSTAWDSDGDTLTATLVGTAPAGLTFNPDGSFTYDGSSGAVSFQYTVSDDLQTSDPITVNVQEVEEWDLTGGSSNFGTFTVTGDYGEGPTAASYTPPTIPHVNSAPITVPDGVYTVIHDRVFDSSTSNSPSLYFNDYDPDYGNSTQWPASVIFVSQIDVGTLGAVSVDSQTGHFSFTAPTQPGD